MKLSKLYSNQPDKFEPIIFNEKLNFIYGDVQNPENKKIDSHNIGKTTLANLLDFMFLSKSDKKHFLLKNKDIFKNFLFFLEISLDENSYLTIRRGVEKASKISFIKHEKFNQNYVNLTENNWDHFELAFEKAKDYLDGKLNLKSIKKWNYRNSINYLIRTQNDFSDVFRIDQRGKDVDWKPYMADLLGFNGNLIKEKYKIQENIEEIEKEIKKINIQNASEELSKIDSNLLISTNELDEIQNFVAKFDFNEIDKKAIEELTNDIDNQIAYLNMKQYTIKNKISHIENSLSEDKIKFNSDKVKDLFEEVNVLFPGQVVKDFNQLIEFNKTITKERNTYLKKELNENKKELKDIEFKLKELNKKRRKNLNFLQESDLLDKFKESNERISSIQAHILILEQQKGSINQIINLKKGEEKLKLTLSNVSDKIQSNMTEVNEDKNNVFAQIRLFFNKIVSKVLDKRGEITVFLNGKKNLEFNAEYQNKTGNTTDESKGNTYQRFLCIAFTLAITRAYLEQNFPRFIYIDGIFDGLDNRKKDLLLEVIREYSDIGIQIIATTIKSEVEGLTQPLEESEIILTLHDKGDDGRLFKMPAW